MEAFRARAQRLAVLPATLIAAWLAAPAAGMADGEGESKRGFDHSAFDRLLAEYVAPDGVRYRAWAAHDEDRKALHEQVRSRWSKVVMAAIAFLLLSGFYNFFLIVSGKRVPADLNGLYQAMFGIKFLLALVIFFIASALMGRSAAFAGIRSKAKLWLTLNLTLAVILVCISGAMRLIRDKALPAAKPAAAMEAPAVPG